MAFIPEEEEQGQGSMDVLGGGQQTQQAPQDQPQQDPTQISGAPTTVGSSGAASAVPTTVSKKDPGSGLFTNIRKYVQANKPQAERLAGAVGRGVTGQAQAISKQLEGQRERFEKLVQGQEQQVQSARQFTERAVQEAGQETLTQPEFKRFQDIASGTTRFDQVAPPEFQKQQARTAALTRLLGSTRRPEARKQLLRQAFAQSSPYTRGQQAIDEAVLAANPQLAKTTVEQAQAPVEALQRQIQTARTAALEDLYGLRSATAGLTGREGSAYKSVAGQEGQLTGLQSALDQAIVQEAERRKSRQSSIADKLRTGQFLTDEDFADLGVAESDRGALQAFVTTKAGDLGKFALQQFLSPFDPKTVTRATVASPEQMARYNELSQLIGGVDIGQTPTGSPLQFNTQAAMDYALQQLNAPGVTYGTQGFQGEQGALEGFQSMLMGLNPLLAMPMMALGTVGDLAGGALGGVGDLAGGAIDTVGDVAGSILNINPFQMSSAQDIIGSGGEVFQSAADLARKLTPDSLDPSKVVNAFISGGSGGVQQVVTEAREAAARAAAAAAAAARSVFCFVRGVPILMADGTEKNIEDLRLGDITHLGGMVVGTGETFAMGELYEYNGTIVTGGHAVFEDGSWTRVAESSLSRITELPETTIVYPIATENQLLVSGDFISADFKEVEGEFGYSPEENLKQLNNNKERNEWLKEEELKLKDKANVYNKAV